MKARASILAVLGIAFWLGDSGRAYSLLGRRWPSTVVMHLQLGSSTSGLFDGSPGWNAVAEGALATWNQNINSAPFRVVRDSTAGVVLRNSANNVAWKDDVYGDSFGDALAITLSLTENGGTSEADVLFNTSYSWNSYRGNVRPASSGGMLWDVRRVALHEFGHVIGLDHPDEHGQSVAAIMNSKIGNIDSLQSDDISGARAVYSGGSGTPTPTPSNRPPSVTASCNPCTVQSGQTTSLSATGRDPDGDSLSYQWSSPQGSFSNANTANPIWTAPAQTGSVTATVTVQDGRGGRDSANITLFVVPRDTMRFGDKLLLGQSLTSSSGRYRLLYQADGNLVLYDDVARVPYWASNTGGTSAGQVVMQADGHLVIYDAQVIGRWGSGTQGNPNAFAALQNDGNFVIYRADNFPLWGSGAR